VFTCSPSQWCQHTLCATSTTALPFVTLHLFHSAHWVCMQLQLLSFSALCSPTPLPAVCWFFPRGRVCHLKVRWLMATHQNCCAMFRVFHCGLFIFRRYLPISFNFHCCSFPSLNPKMIYMLFASCIILVLEPHVFAVSLPQLFPPDHPPLLAPAALPLAATGSND